MDTFDQYQEAPSCLEMDVHVLFIFSLEMSTYLDPCIVTLGEMQSKRAAPQHMIPQLFGWASVSFTKRLPSGNWG